MHSVTTALTLSLTQLNASIRQ